MRQDFPSYEIIVVDDGSTDGTAEYLRQYSGESKLRFVYQRNHGPAAARNAGLKIADGQYISFTDDDCIVPANWLTRLNERFLLSGADIIGGVVRNCSPGIFAVVSQEITNHFVRYFGKDGTSTAFLTSNNISYRRTSILNAGGFDERFMHAGGEERALNYRIIVSGGKSIFAPEIMIDHYHEMDALGFIRQQVNYGRGAYMLYSSSGTSRPAPMHAHAYSELFRSLLRSGAYPGTMCALLGIAAQFFVFVGFGVQMINSLNPLHRQEGGRA